MERKIREKRKRKKKRVEEISQDEKQKIREEERRKIMKESDRYASGDAKGREIKIKRKMK